MRRRGSTFAVTAALLLAWHASARGQTVNPAGMEDTKHNLSVTGLGTVRAMSETRICIFCHTPHNSAPQTPLWNRQIEGQNYEVYTSPTLASGPLPPPFGPTKLCLTCHDGTIAMGSVLNPSGGIAMGGSDTLPAGSLSNFGTDLRAHHPVSFSYQSALPNPELVSTPPSDLVYGGTDEIHCTTCHDPHDDVFGKFLRKDNRHSALCTSCHDIDGWEGSPHAVSTEPVGSNLPRPPKTWPTYTQLGEWGCETCHTPHFAATPEKLLNFTDPAAPDAFTCTSGGCHSSDPAPPHLTAGGGSAATPARPQPDIASQVRKMSAHRQSPGPMTRTVTTRSGRISPNDVTCVDCHNPHAGTDRQAEAPALPGMLAGVSGVDRNGIDVAEARYEYEVCFKCHGDNATEAAFVPRVRNDTNTRRDFDPGNASYHPVVAAGKNRNVPSIPSNLEPGLTASDQMYCSTCHADDEGVSGGPHGSSFPPILRERYETADGTAESHDSYALCYRCHDRTSILSDASFRGGRLQGTASGNGGAAGVALRGSAGFVGSSGGTGFGGGHSGHLAAGTPCSACHDPHGISDEIAAAGGLGATGSHTHLINFDTRIVSPRGGAAVPTFTDTGTFSGRCDLTCHGVDHDGAVYP